jgi:integrase
LIGYGERILQPLLIWLGGVVVLGLAHAMVVGIPTGIASVPFAYLLGRLALGPLAILRLDDLRPPNAPHNLRRVYQAAVAAAGEDLAHLDLHGPHDLRHTFATWLEDAGMPSRVIDELMGHSAGRRGRAGDGSPMGRVYRETTPAMLARVTTVLDDRISLAEWIAKDLLRDSGRPGEIRAG